MHSPTTPTLFPRTGRRTNGATFVTSSSGQRYNATRMATSVSAVCISATTSGIGATSGLALASAAATPRPCSQVRSLLFVLILGSQVRTEDFLFFCVTLRLVLGEYVRDYGFSLPNPVSTHREYLRLRFEVGWCM